MENIRSVVPLSGRRPSWLDVSSNFTDQRECLASYLALETAEVLEGAKPANLISIANRRRACGRNLYELWKSLGAEVIAGSGLAVRELVDRGDSILLLLFSPHSMEDLLKRPSVSAVLRKAGYEELSSLELVLEEVTARMSGSHFPHEIGVFLGYPLKDVAAFMGLVPIPFSCQGPWRIFGDPRDSLRLAEKFRCCRIMMARRLAGGASPFACLGGTNREAGAFFGKVIESDNHNLDRLCVSH